MDIDNLQQNMNTRVVFKEPRGMIRWLQLFFAIIAFSTVVDFYTTIGVNITCPTSPPPPPPPPPSSSPAPLISSSPASNVVSPSSSVAPAASSSSSLAPVVSQAPVVAQALAQAQIVSPKLVITYPFDFTQQKVENSCPGQSYSYSHVSSLNGSPQFFVMTGVLSLIYASMTIVVYLLFSSTYDSIPVWPVADLIITAILCLFWFIASTSFSSGVSLLKSTVVYENLQQAICPQQFLALPGTQCVISESPSWRALNVGLVSGYTSFFLWGAGMWFVYKETHFHTPRDSFGPS